MRVAIYYTPERDHPLTRAAAQWLGRDAFPSATCATAARVPENGVDVNGITAEPRRYGFHATLKAPFRLAAKRGLAELETALLDFCRIRAARSVCGLQIETIGSFFALTLRQPDPGVNALAASVVMAFDRFRAPLSADELVRRRRDRLTLAQERNLAQWGYPYVLDQYRFHMTLTGPVAVADRPAVLDRLRRCFGGFVDGSIAINALSLFVQADAGADFLVHARCPLLDATRATAIR